MNTYIDFENYTPFPASAHIYVEINGTLAFRTDDKMEKRKLIKLDGGLCPVSNIALIDDEKQLWLNVIEVKADFSKCVGNEASENRMIVIFNTTVLETRDANGVPSR